MAEIVGERVERRHEWAKHFDLSDGKKLAVFAPHTHWRDLAGNLRDVDLTFVDAGGGGKRIREHTLNIDADAGGLAIFERDSGKGIRFLFPRAPDRFTARAAYWTLADGTEWEFAARKSGLKTTATVSAARGPRTYRFDAQMLGGLAPPTARADGSLKNAVLTVPRSTILRADGIEEQAGPWRIAGGAAEFDYDDSLLPAGAFPYEIDPTTTFSVAAGADDGRVESSGTVYPPDGAPIVSTTSSALGVQRYFDTQSSTYNVRVCLMRWDTSSLPGPVVSALARLYVTTKNDIDSRWLVAEWYPAANWPIDAADYEVVAAADAHEGTSIASLTTGATNDFDLMDAPANVSMSGYTALRWHIEGGEPTSFNTVGISSFESADPEPQLLVTYEPPPSLPRGLFDPDLVPQAWF